MNTLHDSVWQRRGISWIWDNQALSLVCKAREVWSLRQLFAAKGRWPDDMPSNKGNALVVTGLEGGLDLLSPEEGEKWLDRDIKDLLFSFQDFYEGDGALIFWLASGSNRITSKSSTDDVYWHCAQPFSQETIELGRILWGSAGEYPQEIMLAPNGKPAGLFHLRIT